MNKLRPLLLTLALFAAAPAQDDVPARAARIHREAIVVDTHEDVPDALAEKWADVGQRGATKHFDIPRTKEGGLTAPFFAVYVPASYADGGRPGSPSTTSISCSTSSPPILPISSPPPRWRTSAAQSGSAGSRS